MQQTKQLFKSKLTTATIVSGLFFLCPLGNNALAQTGPLEHADDAPATAALEIDPVAESRANQPASVLNPILRREPLATDGATDPDKKNTPAESMRGRASIEDTDTPAVNIQSVIDSSGYDSSEANARGSRLLPPDPRHESNPGSSRSADEGASEEMAGAASDLTKLDTPNWLMRTLGGLGVVLALLFLLKPLLRRFAGPLGSARAPSGVLEALARYPFGKGQFLVLIKLDSRILLLCQTSQGSNLITEINDPDEVASLLRRVHDEKGESFNRKLEALLHQDHGRQPDDSAAESMTSLTDSAEGMDLDDSSANYPAHPINVIDLTGAADASRRHRFRLPAWPRRSVSSASTILPATAIEAK